jgi:hypothetical protein
VAFQDRHSSPSGTEAVGNIVRLFKEARVKRRIAGANILSLGRGLFDGLCNINLKRRQVAALQIAPWWAIRYFPTDSLRAQGFSRIVSGWLRFCPWLPRSRNDQPRLCVS